MVTVHCAGPHFPIARRNRFLRNRDGPRGWGNSGETASEFSELSCARLATTYVAVTDAVWPQEQFPGRSLPSIGERPDASSELDDGAWTPRPT